MSFYGPIADLFNEVFPSVSESTAKQAVEVLKRFDADPGQFFARVTSVPFQADVIGPFPMTILVRNLQGQIGLARRDTNGMILNVSCDIDNKDLLSFAAAYPEEEYIRLRKLNNEQVAAMKANQLSNVFFLPKPGAYTAIDLSETFTVTREAFEALLASGKAKIHIRLTDQGLRLFQLKYGYHNFRPEKDEANQANNREKASPPQESAL